MHKGSKGEGRGGGGKRGKGRRRRGGEGRVMDYRTAPKTLFSLREGSNIYTTFIII